MGTATSCFARSWQSSIGHVRAKHPREQSLCTAFRVLALKPDDHEARSLVARLLLEAPAEVPPEAQAELDAIEAAARRKGGRVAARRYLTWFCMIPVLVAAGVRSWPLFMVCFVLILISAGASYAVSRLAKPSAWHGVGLLALSMAAASSVSIFLGPFVIVPAVAATNALFFALYTSGRRRALVASMGLAAVLVPFALEALGVVSPSMVVGSGTGGLLLLGRAVAIEPGWTELFLLASSIGLLLTTTVTVGHIRDELAASERRSFLQAWHLRKMVE